VAMRCYVTTGNNLLRLATGKVVLLILSKETSQNILIREEKNL